MSLKIIYFCSNIYLWALAIWDDLHLISETKKIESLSLVPMEDHFWFTVITKGQPFGVLTQNVSIRSLAPHRTPKQVLESNSFLLIPGYCLECCSASQSPRSPRGKVRLNPKLASLDFSPLLGHELLIIHYPVESPCLQVKACLHLVKGCLNHELSHDCKWKTRSLLTSHSALRTVEEGKY